MLDLAKGYLVEYLTHWGKEVVAIGRSTDDEGAILEDVTKHMGRVGRADVVHDDLLDTTLC